MRSRDITTRYKHEQWIPRCQMCAVTIAAYFACLSVGITCVYPGPLPVGHPETSTTDNDGHRKDPKHKAGGHVERQGQEEDDDEDDIESGDESDHDRWFPIAEHMLLPYLCEVNVTEHSGVGVCPSDYWHGPVNGTCYRAFQRRATYQTAAHKCHEVPGGHLAEPRSEAHAEMFREVCEPVKMCWTGVYLQSGTWSYNDGQPVQFEGWMQNEPHSEGLVGPYGAAIGLFPPFLLRHTLKPDWYADESDLKLPFICEKDANESTCQEKWKGPWDASCYLAIRKKLTQKKAQDKCKSMGGHLAYIQSEDENLKVHELCDSLPCWIGLNRTQDGWTWLDGSPVDYESWDHNEDQNSDIGFGAFVSWDPVWWDKHVLGLDNDPRFGGKDRWHEWSWILVVTTLFMTFSNLFVQLSSWLLLRFAVRTSRSDILLCVLCLNPTTAMLLVVTVFYCTMWSAVGMKLSVPVFGLDITLAHFGSLLVNAFVLLYVAIRVTALRRHYGVRPVRTTLRVLHEGTIRHDEEKPRNIGTQAEYNDEGNGAYPGRYSFTNVVGVPLGEAVLGIPATAPTEREIPSVPTISNTKTV